LWWPVWWRRKADLPTRYWHFVRQTHSLLSWLFFSSDWAWKSGECNRLFSANFFLFRGPNLCSFRPWIELGAENLALRSQMSGK
jgi:hypothetical protein